MALASSAFAAQTVDGQVVNSVTGVGVAGARVQFAHREGDRYDTTTDAQGRFRFEGVQEGVYAGFCGARGYWRNFGPNAPAKQYVVKGEPLHLQISIDPIPKISGRVLDPAGEPVAHAPVWALWNLRGCSRPDCFAGAHKAETDDKGVYTIPDIDNPGNWLLSTSAPASLKPPPPADDGPLGWTQTFYPNVTDPQLGTRLAVRAGADLFNIDIKLAAVPVRRIRGRVLDPAGNPVKKAAVAMGRGFGANFQAQTADDGTFEFPAVPDAEWRIEASIDPGTDKLWVTHLLTVKGRDPEALELRLTEPFILRGRVVFDLPMGTTAPDLPHAILGAHSEIPQLGGPRTPDGRPLGPTDDGEFAIDGVYPGAYEITVLDPPPPPFYLDSIRLGVRNALAEDMPIPSDAERLTLTYKYGGGTVRGAIENCGQANVLLIPQDPELRRDQFMRATPCGANGSFEFAGVRPGSYYAIAIAGPPTARWREIGADDRLLNQSTTLTVRNNESTTATVPLVAK